MGKKVETDIYGNNINFSDEIMSEMTTKGLLGKWCETIFREIKYCLKNYYIKTNNVGVGCDNFVKTLFSETDSNINHITKLLEDLTIRELYGIEDIFIAVYGVQSDEVYTLRKFKELYEKIDEWDTDFMWNDCGFDKRLKDIIS